MKKYSYNFGFRSKFANQLSILFSIIFFVRVSQDVVNAQDLDFLCRLYNHSLQIAQITPFHSIALVSICQPDPHSPSPPPRYIESLLSPIVSFDVNLEDRYIVYLTEESSLYISSLSNENSNVQNSAKLFQRLTTVVNDTNLTLADPIWTYNTDSEVKPRQISLDWVHDLLYIVMGQSDIYVSSLFELDQKAHLFHRPQATIKRLLLCPKLSMIVWHEIEWTGQNYNSIQIAQQDGTEMKSIYLSRSYIQDIQVDQHHLVVYFMTGAYLGQIPLKKFHQSMPVNGNEEAEDESKNVPKFLIADDIKHFAILNPYILRIQYGEITMQDLRNQANKHVIPFKHPWTSASIIQAEFTLLTKYSQPNSDPICASKLDSTEKQVCKDICLPNGYIARFTCMCYKYDDQNCTDYGHHYDGEEEHHDDGQLVISSNQNADSDSKREVDSPTVSVPRNVLLDSEVSDDIWENWSWGRKPQEPSDNPENSTEAKLEFQSNDSTNTILNLTIPQQNISDRAPSFDPKRKQLSLLKLMWFVGNRVFSSRNSTSVKFQISTSESSSNSEFLVSLDEWIRSNQPMLIALVFVGGFILIMLGVFLMLFVVAAMSNLRKHSTKVVKINKNNPISSDSSSSKPSKSNEISIVSVNKLYMQPDLVKHEIEQNKFESNFDVSDFKQPNLLTILDSDNDPSSWIKFSTSQSCSSSSQSNVNTSNTLLILDASPPKSKNPKPTMMQMQTFDNWEYAQVNPQSSILMEPMPPVPEKIINQPTSSLYL